MATPQKGSYRWTNTSAVTSQRQRRPPNAFIQGAMMSALNITSNKPKTTINSIQGFKSRGRGKLISHINITERKLVLFLFLKKDSVPICWENCLYDIWTWTYPVQRYLYSVTLSMSDLCAEKISKLIEDIKQMFALQCALVAILIVICIYLCLDLISEVLTFSCLKTKQVLKARC